MISKHPSV